PSRMSVGPRPSRGRVGVLAHSLREGEDAMRRAWVFVCGCAMMLSGGTRSARAEGEPFLFQSSPPSVGCAPAPTYSVVRRCGPIRRLLGLCCVRPAPICSPCPPPLIVGGPAPCNPSPAPPTILPAPALPAPAGPGSPFPGAPAPEPNGAPAQQPAP